MDHLTIISPVSVWPFYQVSTRLNTKMLFLQHSNFTVLTEEKTCLHCTSPHSKQSQPANCSSDRQHQKLQPHTLQGCHFDITLAYPDTDLFLIFGSAFKHTQNSICWKVCCSIRVTYTCHFYRYSSGMCSYCDKNIYEIRNQFLNSV